MLNPPILVPEKRSALKLQPAPALPLEHLDPQTPQLTQLVGSWQRLWLLAVARQTRLDQHQLTLIQVPVLLIKYRIQMKGVILQTHLSTI